MNRHIREEHAKGGATCKKKRRKAQDGRAVLLRAHDVGGARGPRGGATLGGGEARGEGGGGATPYKMYVTSPIRRKGYYEALLTRFAEAGFTIANIRRRRGMDYAMYRAEAARAAETAARAAKPRRKYGGAIPPAGLKKCQFLHWDFWANFLTTAKRDFEENPALRFVFWVEDDAAFRPSGETCPADRVLQACESNWPSATWCGYSRVGASLAIKAICWR